MISMPGDGVDLYLGEGNDFAFVELADLAIDSVIDGGSGSDWLSFIVDNGAGYLNGNPQKSITFNLSTDSGNAVSFENIEATQYDDQITGDSSNNIIRGRLGSDTIYGGEGADTIYGEIEDDLFGDSYDIAAFYSQTSYGDDAGRRE